MPTSGQNKQTRLRANKQAADLKRWLNAQANRRINPLEATQLQRDITIKKVRAAQLRKGTFWYMIKSLT